MSFILKNLQSSSDVNPDAGQSVSSTKYLDQFAYFTRFKFTTGKYADLE
jgi:hypothetical protein